MVRSQQELDYAVISGPLSGPVHDMSLLCIVGWLSLLCNEPFWNIAGQISREV